jgi:hypothetical protein
LMRHRNFSGKKIFYLSPNLFCAKKATCNTVFQDKIRGIHVDIMNGGVG